MMKENVPLIAWTLGIVILRINKYVVVDDINKMDLGKILCDFFIFQTFCMTLSTLVISGTASTDLLVLTSVKHSYISSEGNCKDQSLVIISCSRSALYT